jgi:hypothetical protein
MAEARAKRLTSPGKTFPLMTVQLADLGDVTVGHIVLEPGWRWSTHVRPHVGGDWCEARHVGVVLSGRFEAMMRAQLDKKLGSTDTAAKRLADARTEARRYGFVALVEQLEAMA